MIGEEDVLKIFQETGAVVTGHFIFTSAKHGSVYLNKDAVYPHTKEISQLCLEFAEKFADDEVEVVIAPAIGGVILSQWTAYHLSEITGHEVLGIYAEKSGDGDAFVIKRGYDKIVPGKKVLVVEDILTTGGSVKKVMEAVRALGGDIVGLGVLCNRGGVIIDDIGNIPKLIALLNLELLRTSLNMSFQAYDPLDCPLCKDGVPINNDVGKGK